MALGFLGRYREVGLLILRVGVGAIFLKTGWPLISNPGKWQGLGEALAAVGFTPSPTVAKVFGFLAALSQFGGGICLILGFFFRPACIMMAGTMAVALAMHLKGGDPFQVFLPSLESLIVFVSLMFIGPGKISIERE
jgi:putative oxidoreductase